MMNFSFRLVALLSLLAAASLALAWAQYPIQPINGPVGPRSPVFPQPAMNQYPQPGFQRPPLNQQYPGYQQPGYGNQRPNFPQQQQPWTQPGNQYSGYQSQPAFRPQGMRFGPQEPIGYGNGPIGFYYK